MFVKEIKLNGGSFSPKAQRARYETWLWSECIIIQEGTVIEMLSGSEVITHKITEPEDMNRLHL